MYKYCLLDDSTYPITGSVDMYVCIANDASLSLLPFSVSQDSQAPSKVTGVSLSKAVRQGRPALTVSWTAPQSDVTTSEYVVQYRKSGTTVWGGQAMVSPPATSTQLPALDAGTEYDVQVRARSAAGDGEWSEVQTERTFNSKFTCSICCYQLHVNYSVRTVVLLSECQLLCCT